MRKYNFFLKKIGILFLSIAGLYLFLEILKYFFSDMISYILSSAVCFFVKLFGQACGFASGYINSENYTYLISFDCSGLDVTLLFLVLGVSFFGVSDKKILKELLIISLLIFILNFIKMVVFILLAEQFGFFQMKLVHDISFNYIQGVVVLIIFFIYTSYKLKEISTNRKNRK